MSLKCAAQYFGLAIDTTRQKLYYADMSGGEFGELSTDGPAAHRVLFIYGTSKPYALVSDDDNRWSYVVV